MKKFEMKLRKTRANGGKCIRVPKELEPFVQFLLHAGYKETTVATIVEDLRAAQKMLERGEDPECKSKYTRHRYRYALRKYEEWLKRNRGGDVDGAQRSRKIP